VGKTGFGHEEWLFDYSRQLDGYHYGFVEALNRTRQIESGQVIDLLLYAISPDRQRYYVGEIRECELLTEEDRQRVVEEYERRGWLQQMRHDVCAIGGNPSRITTGHSDYNTGIFNIRFRPEDAECHVSGRLADEEDRVWKRTRYMLYKVESADIEAFRRLPSGRQKPLPVERVHRAGTASICYDPTHRRLQNHLFQLLEGEFGQHVFLERSCVDVMVTHPEFHAYIEVKTCANAVQAIREGVGQLLEYVYRDFAESTSLPRCVICSPAPETDDSRGFLQFLSRKAGFPIDYWEVGLSTKELKIKQD